MKITFNIATPEGPVSVNGEKILLDVGGKKEAFAVHADSDGRGPKRLTHFATGRIVIPAAAFLAVKVQRGMRTSDREAATVTLRNLIDRIGVDKFRETVGAAPVINP